MRIQITIHLEPEFLNCKCMGETWYLACDMQMLLVSPLVIYPLWRWRRAGLTWALLVMAFSIGINIAARIAWDLPPTFITSRP